VGIRQIGNSTRIDNLVVPSGGTLNLTGVTVTGLTVSVTGGGIYASSITNMQALTLDDGDVVICYGYYSASDGYNGIWQYDEAASDVNDYGSYVPHNSTGGFYRAFENNTARYASDFGIFTGNSVIDSARLTSFFAHCENIGAEINFGDAGQYIIPDTFTYTFNESISVKLGAGTIITSYTGSNFANIQPEFIDVTLNGAKLPIETYYRVRYTAKDAVVHSTYSHLTPIALDEYLYKNGSGVWSKVTKSTIAALNYLLPIDVGVITRSVSHTSGSDTITSASELKAGDVIEAAAFPANTVILSVSGGKTSWTATLNNEATATGTSSATMYAQLPSDNGYYIVEKLRDTYSGSLNPKVCPQFPSPLSLNHGMVVRKNGSSWTIVDMPILFNTTSGASIKIIGGTFKNLTQDIFNYAHGTGAPTGAIVDFSSNVHNVNKVCAKSNQESSVAGGTITDSNIRVERLNPAALDTVRIHDCNFTNIGKWIMIGIRIDNLIVDNVVISNSSSMITGIYTIDALNVSYTNIQCNYLSNYDSHNGLWLRGGQLATTFENITYTDCSGILLYASGNRCIGSNLNMMALQYPQFPVGGSPLLIKGGGNSTEYGCVISNSYISHLYSNGIGIVRDSDIQISNSKVIGARNISVDANTELENSGNNDYFNRNYQYTIADSAGLTRFETLVNSNYRQTGIAVGDGVFFDPRQNQWIKNIFTTSPPATWGLSLALSHNNRHQTYTVSNCIMDCDDFTKNPDSPTYNFIITGGVMKHNRVIISGTTPNAVNRFTVSGGTKIHLSGDLIAPLQCFFDDVSFYKRKGNTLRIQSNEVYLNNVKFFNTTNEAGSTLSEYVLRIVCQKLFAVGVQNYSTWHQGKIYEVSGATEIYIEGGLYKMTPASGSVTPMLVELKSGTTLDSITLKGVSIEFPDVATKRVINRASGYTAISNAKLHGCTYNINPTTEISGSGFTLDTLKSVLNDHTLAASALSTVTPSIITTFNANDW